MGATRMNSRANAVRLRIKAMLIAKALEKIAKPIVAGLESTCIDICGRGVWSHSNVMQRMLSLSARARLAGVQRMLRLSARARLATAAAARLLMSRADTVANAWATSEVPIASLRPRAGRRREREVIIIVREPATIWLVVVMRSNRLAPCAGVSASIVQGAVPHRLEDLDLKEGREGVRVDRVVRRG